MLAPIPFRTLSGDCADCKALNRLWGGLSLPTIIRGARSPNPMPPFIAVKNAARYEAILHPVLTAYQPTEAAGPVLTRATAESGCQNALLLCTGATQRNISAPGRERERGAGGATRVGRRGKSAEAPRQGAGEHLWTALPADAGCIVNSDGVVCQAGLIQRRRCGGIR